MYWFKGLPKEHPISQQLMAEFGDIGYYHFLMVSAWCQEFESWEVTEKLIKNMTGVKTKTSSKYISSFQKHLENLRLYFQNIPQTNQEQNKNKTETKPLSEGVNPCAPIKDRQTEKTDKTEREKDPPTPQGESEFFNRFWESYPKKVGKSDCKRIWSRKRLDSLGEQIIDSVKRYTISDDWTKEAGQFIPNPATYLNQGRWDDEIKGPKPPTSKLSEESKRVRGIGITPSEERIGGFKTL